MNASKFVSPRTTFLMRKVLTPAKTGTGTTASPFPVRFAVTKTTGEFLPEPKKVPLGIASVGGTVAVGLLLGAAISKNIASFLEENELFVPSDDDDDD